MILWSLIGIYLFGVAGIVGAEFAIAMIWKAEEGMNVTLTDLVAFAGIALLWPIWVPTKLVAGIFFDRKT